MKRILRSFRWQLQLWHSLLLLLVLGAFCIAALFVERERTMRWIDQQLRDQATELASNLARGMDALGKRAKAPHGTASPVRIVPGGSRRAGPHGRGRSMFYHVIWEGGRVIERSENAPADIQQLPPASRRASENFRHRRHARELVVPGPRNTWLLVGRDIHHDGAELWHHAIVLAIAGAGVLAVGVIGGWWVAGRAIRPVVDISATAEKIAAGNLRERIDPSRFASEFSGLAATLNHTFDRLQATLLRQVQFTADASHELRTPVAVTLLTSQSALSRDRSPAEYREALETCQRAAQRMRELVESLLLLARLDAHDERTSHELLDLRDPIDSAVELLQPLAAKHGVTVETALAPVRVVGDATQLARVVGNLLSNAIHHSPAGATVQIGLVARDADAVLSVSDRGEGISAEDLPHIFDRFYRADQSRRHTEGRTGLGLAISKAIVEAHGGRIEVASERSQGSTFTVVLPMSNTPAVSL